MRPAKDSENRGAASGGAAPSSPTGKRLSPRASLLFFALATLGLVLVAVWSDVVGYSATLMPLAQDADNSAVSAAFSWGRLALSVLFVCFPRFIERNDGWLMAAVSLGMAFGTALFALAASQSTFDPTLLAASTAFMGGMGFTMLSVPFFLLLARHALPRTAAVCVAASLVGEALISLTLTFCASQTVQVIACAFAAPLAVGCYLACRRLAGLGFVGGASSSGAVFGGKSAWGGPVASTAGKYLLFAQFTLAIIAAALLRSLSSMGAWGQSRGNYLGMSSMDWPVLLGLCAAILVVSLAIFVIPRKASNQARCTVGLVVVLACLQVAVLGDGLDGTAGGPATLVMLVPVGCQLFCRMLQWVLFMECAVRLADPPLRVQGAASICNALAGLIVSAALSAGASPSAVVMMFMYALVLVSGAALTHLVLQGRPSAQASVTRASNAAVPKYGVAGEPSGAAPSAVSGDALLFHAPQPRSADASNQQEDPLARFADAHGISARERQVLAMLLQGKTRTQIGQALDLSEGTVRTHVNAVYHKLGVHAKSEAQALFERETAARASAQTAVQSEQA